jgi:16S rRNA (cytidine1402-2'-O)-methyltransferase
MAKLSIVATPIGNLEDITLRALRVLKEANVVFCEDTRVTRKLFDRYEIGTPLRRLDANIELKGAEQIIECLKRGDNVAYVTDAGTPTISDPGYRMVALVREYFSVAPSDVSARSRLKTTPQLSRRHLSETLSRSHLSEAAQEDTFLQPNLSEVTIEAIPGPSAITAALSIAGVPADNFLFLGFLPHKKGRQTMLKKIAETETTVVLYESSHRILKLLEELQGHIPGRQVVVLREITKKFEEVRVGAPVKLSDFYSNLPEHQKGEFVAIIAPTN